MARCCPLIVVGDKADLEFPPEPLVPRSVSREAAFVEAAGFPAQRARNAGFDEVAVTPGAKVAVHGVVELERDPNAEGYRDGVHRARLVGHANHPLTIGRPR